MEGLINNSVSRLEDAGPYGWLGVWRITNWTHDWIDGRVDGCMNGLQISWMKKIISHFFAGSTDAFETVATTANPQPARFLALLRPYLPSPPLLKPSSRLTPSLRIHCVEWSPAASVSAPTHYGPNLPMPPPILTSSAICRHKRRRLQTWPIFECHARSLKEFLEVVIAVSTNLTLSSFRTRQT